MNSTLMNNSLTQYLDLYDSARPLIESASPAALNDLRPAALQALQAFGRFPRRGDESYATTDVNALYAADFGLNLNRLPLGADASFRCDIPALSTLMGVTVNDSFLPSPALERTLPQGVEVMPLARAAELYPELVASHLNGLAANATAVSALNTLLLQDGVFVRVADGVSLDRPVQIVNTFRSSAAVMAVRRVLLVAGEGSSVRLLLCDHSPADGISRLSCQITEIYAGAGSHVELYDLEKNSCSTARTAELHARLERGARLSLNASTLTGGSTRNAYTVTLEGEGAEASLSGLAIGSGTQTADTSVRLRHTAPHCSSQQLFKYVLFDSARGDFNGIIRVDHGAVGTSAVQTNRNLLACTDARMHTEPQLEIYCDDVRCGHGAATGQLDEQALFYMQQRGIPRDQARMMLIQAFMADVVDAIGPDALRDRIRLLVEKRLGCTSPVCGDCAAACATSKS